MQNTRAEMETEMKKRVNRLNKFMKIIHVILRDFPNPRDMINFCVHKKNFSSSLHENLYNFYMNNNRFINNLHKCFRFSKIMLSKIKFFENKS